MAQMRNVAGDDQGMKSARDNLVNLMVAAKNGDWKALRRQVRSLCDKKNRTVSSEALVLSSYADGAGRTALHFAANYGSLACTRYIITTAPEAVTWTDDEGSTGLIMASLGGHTPVVDLLLSNGALVNHARQNGDMALHMACRHAHADTLASLLGAGAEADAVGSEGSALWTAARHGSLSCIQPLVDAGATVDAFDSHGITPLIIAATAQHADVVEALLQVGANVAHVADQGITALHMAAEHGSVDVIRKLLSTDAGKSAALMKDAHGLKPVELAAGNEFREIVEFLFPFSEMGDQTVDSLVSHHAEVRRKELAEHIASQQGPTISAEDKERAKAIKADGNKQFLAKAFDAALELYTQAAEIDPTNHALWSNRAACYMALGQFEQALEDADRCIKVNPDWAKGHYRKGKALEAMERHEDASLAYWEAAKRDAKCKEFRTSFQRALKAAQDQFQEKQAAEKRAAKKKKREADAAASAGAGTGAAAAEGATATAEGPVASSAGAAEAAAAASSTTATADGDA